MANSPPRRPDPPSDFLPRARRPFTGEPTTGFIIVRLARRYDFPPGSTLLDVATAAPELSELRQFLIDNDLRHSTPAIVSLSPQEVLALESEAAGNAALAPSHSLLEYWRVDARPSSAGGVLARLPLKELTRRLNATPGVRLAYEESVAFPPGVDASDDPRAIDQTHLDPPIDAANPGKAGGIDARPAWGYPGGTGAGVTLVDIELGWFAGHEDLQGQPIVTLAGVQDTSWMGHGTSVIGLVAAVDNALGGIGIAPAIGGIVLVPADKQLAGGPVQLVADAIVRGIVNSAPGDVILLEMQSLKPDSKYYPVECDELDFTAIRLASALGRVVIEAAGNGQNKSGDSTRHGLNLDQYQDPWGKFVLRRDPMRESGATLVSGSWAVPPYERVEESNFGTRVDCFAPGELVTSSDYLAGYPAVKYRSDFSGTSAASAIVAGAAVVVQGMWKARTGTPLSPLQLRALLADPLYNHPSANPTDGIGVMPTLGAIATQVLPDVYLRDAPLDEGSVPTTGTASLSPDIIVWNVDEANPNALFGEGSGTEQSGDLSEPVTLGTTQYLYARVRNRGPVDATGAQVTFFWSPPATLVHPDQWNLIGTSSPFTVPAGNALTVSPSVSWGPVAHPPTAGHFCFIAVADYALDRAPPLPTGPGGLTWDQFEALIRNNNNVAWRNFDVVPMAALSRGAPIELTFCIVGDRDSERDFVVEVIAWQLPGRVQLVLPPELRYQLQRDDGAADHDLGASGGMRRRRVRLAAGATHRCTLVLHPPYTTPSAVARLAVRQWHAGLEVGRISWGFETERRPRRVSGRG